MNAKTIWDKWVPPGTLVLDEANVKRRYKELSLVLHPDKNPDEIDKYTGLFQTLGNEYSYLKGYLESHPKPVVVERPPRPRPRPRPAPSASSRPAARPARPDSQHTLFEESWNRHKAERDEELKRSRARFAAQRRSYVRTPGKFGLNDENINESF